MATLRELLLSIKVAVDKTAVQQTDQAFDHAAASAAKFERTVTSGAQKAVAALSAVQAKLAGIREAMLPDGALPARRPEAPSDRAAREAGDALGLSGKSRKYPAPPRPAGADPMAAPDVAAFVAPKGLDAFRAKVQSVMASAGAFVERFNSRFDALASSIFNARTALAGFAVVMAAQAVANFVGGVVESGAELHTMAQRTRMSAETLQVWRDVASGVNADASAVTSAFTRLSRAMSGAAKGGKDQAAAFKELGVNVKNGDGSLRDREDVLIDVGVALAAMDDDAKAATLSAQLLGPAGAALVPAFKDGADAIRKQTAALRENVAMTGEEAARLEEVGSAFERGAKKWKALKERLVILLLPALEAVSKAFEGMSKWFLRMAKETKALQTAFAALAAGGLVRASFALAAWVQRIGGAQAAMRLLGQGIQTAARFLWRFLLPALALEDFLVFLAGGKSLFGRAFEEIFGPGGAQSAREGILAVLTDIGNVVTEDILPAIQAVMTSGFLTGAAKLALSGILSVLNAIGILFAKNGEAADAATARFLQNSEAVVKAIDGMIAKFKEWLGVQAENPAAKEQAVVQEREAQSSSFWSALAAAGSFAGQGFGTTIAPRGSVPTPAPKTPAAPPSGSKSITINDQRKLEVTVGGGSSPGATGRAVAGSVSVELGKDRRQTLAGVSG